MDSPDGFTSGLASNMNNWWQGLEARERAVILLGGAVVIAALIFLTVVEPLAQKRLAVTTTLNAEKLLLERIAGYAAEAESIRQQIADTPNEIRGRDQSLLSVIDNAASAAQVKNYIRRVVPNGTNQANLAFDSVPFDNLVKYLVELQSQFGVVVTRINTDKLTEPGLVRANLTLQR